MKSKMETVAALIRINHELLDLVYNLYLLLQEHISVEQAMDIEARIEEIKSKGAEND